MEWNVLNEVKMVVLLSEKKPFLCIEDNVVQDSTECQFVQRPQSWIEEVIPLKSYLGVNKQKQISLQSNGVKFLVLFIQF